MLAKTIQGSSIHDLQQKLDFVLQQKDFEPTLAFLFCDHTFDLGRISALFNKHQIALCGSTTAGEIFNTSVAEESIVCLLLDIDPAYFEVFLGDYDTSTEEVAAELGKKAAQKFQTPSLIVISSGLDTDGEAVVNGLMQHLSSQVKIFGGLAGDNFEMIASYVFDNQRASSAGLVGVIIDSDKVLIDGIAASGWQAVGVEKIVTKSSGNIVYTIDHEPAMDVYKKYFGLTTELDTRNGIINTLGAQYPLQVKRANGQSVIRAPLLANPDDNSLIFAGAVEEGAKVQFSVPPHFDIVVKVIKEAEMLKQESPKVAAMIMFSCKARHTALGPMIEEEVSGIQELWGAPMIGFFSYGEFGALAASNCDFHNETCSLVLIQEK